MKGPNMNPTYCELLAALAKMTDRYHRAILATGALDWVACAATEDAVDLIARAGDRAPLVVAPAPTENGREVAVPLRLPGWTNEHKAQRNADITKRYQQGVSISELAAEYGISVPRVYQILGKKKVKTAERIKEVIRLRELGLSFEAIAKEVGLRSPGHMHRIIAGNRPDLLGSRAAINGAHSEHPAA
jgi:transcriptional regulator with XRE-family HTH domain